MATLLLLQSFSSHTETSKVGLVISYNSRSSSITHPSNSTKVPIWFLILYLLKLVFVIIVRNTNNITLSFIFVAVNTINITSVSYPEIASLISLALLPTITRATATKVKQLIYYFSSQPEDQRYLTCSTSLSSRRHDFRLFI